MPSTPEWRRALEKAQADHERTLADHEKRLTETEAVAKKATRLVTFLQDAALVISIGTTTAIFLWGQIKAYVHISFHK